MTNKIKVIENKIINHKDGNILKGINHDDDDFDRFGELYFSYIKLNAIKAWKKHNQMKMNLFVPFGKVKFVFFSKNFVKLKELIVDGKNNNRITVRPKIWYGFKGLFHEQSLVVNLANISHSDFEMERLEINNEFIDYDWNKE